MSVNERTNEEQSKLSRRSRVQLSELVCFGRVLEREGRRLAARDDLCDLIEVSGADLALVTRRRVAVLLGRELRSSEYAAMPRSLYFRASSNIVKFSAWKPARVTNWNL
jgi:hypothetical protein